MATDIEDYTDNMAMSAKLNFASAKFNFRNAKLNFTSAKLNFRISLSFQALANNR